MCAWLHLCIYKGGGWGYFFQTLPIFRISLDTITALLQTNFSSVHCRAQTFPKVYSPYPAMLAHDILERVLNSELSTPRLEIPFYLTILPIVGLLCEININSYNQK